MNRAILVLGLLLMLVPAGGCWGPQKVTRNVDDWLQQGYVKRPWLFGNAAAAAAILVANVVTRFIDGLAVNPVDFWGLSAWPFGDGSGTPFHFRPVAVPAAR